MAVVFAVCTQVENHILNPVVMSKTVRINPLLVFIAVLVGASLGNLIGGFVAALLAIPTAGALQVLVKEVWQATAPDQPQETPAPAAGPADECSGGKGGAGDQQLCTRHRAGRPVRRGQGAGSQDGDFRCGTAGRALARQPGIT